MPFLTRHVGTFNRHHNSLIQPASSSSPSTAWIYRRHQHGSTVAINSMDLPSPDPFRLLALPPVISVSALDENRLRLFFLLPTSKIDSEITVDTGRFSSPFQSIYLSAFFLVFLLFQLLFFLWFQSLSRSALWIIIWYGYILSFLCSF